MTRRYCYPQCRDPFFNECADCWKSGGNPARDHAAAVTALREKVEGRIPGGVSERRERLIAAVRLLQVMDAERAWSQDDAREAAGVLRWYVAESDRRADRCVELEYALAQIASVARPDGTYNLSREACEQLAREALYG